LEVTFFFWYKQKWHINSHTNASGSTNNFDILSVELVLMDHFLTTYLYEFISFFDKLIQVDYVLKLITYHVLSKFYLCNLNWKK